MFRQFLIYVALLGLAAADVKHLSREYLPASEETVITKVNSEYASPSSAEELIMESPLFSKKPELVDSPELPVLQQDEIVDNNIESDLRKAAIKETTNDPAYGNGAYGFNGLPGSYPGAYPSYPVGSQGFGGQGFPGQGFPGQGFVGQGFPGQGFPPSQGFINPGQGFAGQGLPGQGFPGQGFPGQGFPGQGFPGQGFPGQGFPGQGFPGQGFPGQGFAGQGFPPSQGFINPGFAGQGFPGQGFPGQGIPNPAYPNYPHYHTSQQLKQEAKPQAQDEKLRLRVASDTVYDKSNDGYLYERPSLTF